MRWDNNADWTDDRIALVTKLWGDGLSGTQIASELGGLSRSAVIGKVHRLGLPERMPGINCNRAHLAKPRKPGAAPKERRKPDALTNGLRLLAKANRNDPGLAAKYAPPISDLDIPPEQRKSILDLTNTTCRWPVWDVGDVGFFFCGAEGADLTDHRPYCPHHSRVARQPPTGATRKQWRGGF